MKGAQLLFMLACEVSEGRVSGEALQLAAARARALALAPAPKAADSAHLMLLRRAQREVCAQLAEIEASALAEVSAAVDAYRQAHGVETFAPANLRASHRDRGRLLAAMLDAHEAAMAKRAGQVRQLQARLRQLHAAVAAAEGKGQA